MTSSQTYSPQQLIELKQALREEAAQLGLHQLAITTATPADSLAAYEHWIEQGYHGEMGYLARPDRLDRRRDLNVILPGVQRLIIFTLPYWPGTFPDEQQDPMRGAISCYAWGRDYHKILGKKLKTLSRWLEEHGDTTRWYVDTGAIQERDLAERAGLGFTGKHTLLIQPQYGSGFFLGEILSSLPFPLDTPSHMPSCGTCSRCLTACPTDAFVAPYILDARKCISYLTIELKGSIPVELRPLIGNRIYGCDVCQQVCPWMRFADADESPLWGSPPEEVTAPKLIELLELDEEGFQRRFEGSPIRRLKRGRLLRNVAVALGNTGSTEAIEPLNQACEDDDPLVREHAQWALTQLQAQPA
ncbi:MAG: tRNA epoxyqueuosine(34) reductase QueG [Deltaproteobacteria bacterium]|nr:tRNA epoxyqueuosine(34) reductase QueG [Deltaproteobacteria bacterium]|tara:strand:- start:8284 stop:9360 length:1077 start_codon:yes stop_codon:yes gene_type:complete